MKQPIFLTFMLVACAGCAGGRGGPYASHAADQRDIAKAERLYQEAKGKLKDDAVKAEELLREALSWDLYHGGAHNNLGVMLLQQDKLYDAAEEFEWARKLLPGNPEPRVNLALVLDRAGRSTEALEAARTALEVMPENLSAIQIVALLQVREGKTDATTPALLDQISMRAEDPEWRHWAESQRDRLQGTN